MAFRQNIRKQIEALPEFDETKTYTPAQLDLYATKWLIDQRDERKENREPDDGPKWLTDDQVANRNRREILNKEGVPDPAKVSGIYNRTHPEGRKVNSTVSREKHGAGFYR